MVCFEVEVVAIERPDGVLVRTAAAAGVQVLALHPNQVKAARDRFRASGGKSDRFDRFVLCELARTDRHRFRLLDPDSDQTKAIKALTRAREDLVAARVALGNQLRAELERFWPGPVGLFSSIDSPISLAFLTRYPSPADARGLGEKRMAAFLKAHHYPMSKTAVELLERLRAAPAGRAGEVETRTRRQIVLRLTVTLAVMVEQIRELESEIADALDAHRDGEIFRSFFRSRDSVICAATLLGEIGDCRDRYPHRDAIAADSGQAPVAVESGKRRNATFRWACNQRLRAALSTLAHNTGDGTHGPLTATTTPANVATTTAARCAPSAAPGHGSCGAAGRTAPLMTLPGTPGCNNTSPSPSRPPQAVAPTSHPQTAWPPARSPSHRPTGPRIPSSSTPDRPRIPPWLDTGRLPAARLPLTHFARGSHDMITSNLSPTFGRHAPDRDVTPAISLTRSR